MINSLVGKLIEPVTGLLDKFIPDKDLKNQLAHDIATMAEDHMHEEVKLQMEVNKQEAAHKSLFVAGWRPFIGWVCGVALAYNFILRDLLVWFIGPEQVPPALQMEHLMTVLIGMLGLGGMRTFEKFNNKSN